MKILNIILGVIMVIGGCVCAFNPIFSAITLGQILGILLLIFAVNLIFNAVRNSSDKKDIIFAAILAIAGLLLLFNSFVILAALNTIAIIFAVVTLISGVGQIYMGFNIRQSSGIWWFILLSGVLSTLLSLFILMNPFTGFLVVDLMFAFEIISSGITMITFGIS